MNCKDLRRIEGFTEHRNSSELPAEHSVGVRRLRGPEEALIITLEEGAEVSYREMERKHAEIRKSQAIKKHKTHLGFGLVASVMWMNTVVSDILG